jgi:hypothetical protein
MIKDTRRKYCIGSVSLIVLKIVRDIFPSQEYGISQCPGSRFPLDIAHTVKFNTDLHIYFFVWLGEHSGPPSTQLVFNVHWV